MQYITVNHVQRALIDWDSLRRILQCSVILQGAAAPFSVLHDGLSMHTMRSPSWILVVLKHCANKNVNSPSCMHAFLYTRFLFN